MMRMELVDLGSNRSTVTLDSLLLHLYSYNICEHSK